MTPSVTAFDWINLGLSVVSVILSIIPVILQFVLRLDDESKTLFSGFGATIGEFFFVLFAIKIWENQPVTVVLFSTVIFGILFTVWALQNQSSIRVQPKILIIPSAFFAALTVVSAEVGMLFFLGYL